MPDRPKAQKSHATQLLESRDTKIESIEANNESIDAQDDFFSIVLKINRPARQTDFLFWG